MTLKLAVAATLAFSIITVASIQLINLYQYQTNAAKSNDSQIEQQPTLPAYSTEQVAAHNTASDCWIIVNTRVYNVTNFIAIHPGGADRILNQCGSDATKSFTTQGGEGQHSASAQAQLKSMQIGFIEAQNN